MPLAYPKLRLKFGDQVTYVDAPKQHVIVEFSFDVVQAAGGTYLPEAYQRFIGFRVASGLLQRAFQETYGLEMKDVFADMDRSIATYRYSVSEIIPALTEAAWRDKHDEIVQLHPALERTGFVFAYGRTAFEREYGHDYQRPGWFARFLAFIYRILPKVGPLAPLVLQDADARGRGALRAQFPGRQRRLRDLLREVGTRPIRVPQHELRHRPPRPAAPTHLRTKPGVNCSNAWTSATFEGVDHVLRARISPFTGPAGKAGRQPDTRPTGTAARPPAPAGSPLPDFSPEG